MEKKQRNKSDPPAKAATPEAEKQENEIKSDKPPKRTAPSRRSSAAGRAGRSHAARLAESLEKLRQDVQRVLARYTAQVDGRLTRVIWSLRSADSSAASSTLPTGAIAEASQKVRSLGLKPDKGRAKDLSRAAKLAKQLERTLCSESKPRE
jgi:hypothetical protein